MYDAVHFSVAEALTDFRVEAVAAGAVLAVVIVFIGFLWKLVPVLGAMLRQRDEAFLSAQTARDDGFITALKEQQASFIESHEKISLQARETARECHEVHLRSIGTLERAARVLERLEHAHERTLQGGQAPQKHRAESAG